jgi:hypothetical protein
LSARELFPVGSKWKAARKGGFLLRKGPRLPVAEEAQQQVIDANPGMRASDSMSSSTGT